VSAYTYGDPKTDSTYGIHKQFLKFNLSDIAFALKSFWLINLIFVINE